MLTPRPYLSHSQMVLFEKSPAEYAKRYIYNEKQYVNKNIRYGSLMAEGLENEESTGDILLDIVVERLPKFERMDLPVEDPTGPEITYRNGKTAHIPVLMDGNVEIPLLALPDTSKATYEAFKEYKTSVRKWTQEMADKSDQLTFYTTAMWIVTSKVPSDIELINAQVCYGVNGQLEPTGDIWAFKTTRSLIDIIKMTKRIKKTWAGIQQLCEKELL